MKDITEAQVSLINKLKAEREPTAEAKAEMTMLRLEHHTRGTATSSRASKVIAKMLECPVKNVRRDLEAGVYQTTTGNLIRVYHGQHSGRMLAKAIIQGSERVWFQYMGAAHRFVPAGARRLTAEELGSATLAMNSTICLVCGRRLDVPESVQAGIGPKCAKNY